MKKNRKKPYISAPLITMLAWAALSTILSLFAVKQYMAAIPLAGENLRGLALSVTAAIETLATRDASLRALADFNSTEVAYLEILDRTGTILFHSNPKLIGSKVDDKRYATAFQKREFQGQRVLLGTGEEIYESNAPIHAQGTLILRLALHAFRADGVIRRARTSMAVTLSLVAVTWVLGILLYRSARESERQKRELAQKEQMARMGEMGAVIAHEIRNPLAGIKGYAQLLQERTLRGENSDFAAFIVTEAIKLEKMISDLLAYSRSDAAPPEPVNVGESLAGALEVINETASGSGVEVSSSIDQSLTVSANPDRLQQLFINLLRNALQAMPNQGFLQVSASRNKTMVEILISDTGQGIAQGHLGRVFEPFFTTKARGTGLGLAICKKIAEDYHGSIAVESRPGEGTTFRVAIPSPGKTSWGNPSGVNNGTNTDHRR